MGAGSSPWKDLHGILPQESNGSIFPDNSSVASLSQSQSLARGLSHIPSEEISRMNIMEPVPVGHEKTATRAYRTIQRNATINMKVTSALLSGVHQGSFSWMLVGLLNRE